MAGHDNEDIVHFYAGHDGFGNVQICCEILAPGSADPVGAVSFTATPKTIEKFVGSMIVAIIKAKSGMPELKMSPQELPQSSEAHNGW